MTSGRLRVQALAAVAILGVALAGCGGGKKKTTSAPAATSVSGHLSWVGIWVGPEQKAFQAVLDAFHKKYPKVTVKYDPAGDNTPTVLSTAISGGRPPDFASVSQPGLITQYQKRGVIKPMEFARSTITANFSPGLVKQFFEINGKLYTFIFKGANKSTVWYNVSAFKNAGVTPPATWTDFLKAAKTLKASGVPAYSIDGSDGWPLTDLFENIYLRQAGVTKYDQLTKHQIKWTDPSVITALKTMQQVIGDKPNIYGGISRASQTDFPTSVSNVFVNPPKAAMEIEADFVPGVVAGKTSLKPKTGYDEFAFPAIGSSGSSVVEVGGDSVIMFKDSPAARALVNYLASPEAGEVRAKLGGFTSLNKGVPASAYSDPIQRRIASAVSSAQTVRFDLSDLQPVEFGGTIGQGEWKIFNDFLVNQNVSKTASALEAAAAKAYK